MNDLISNLKINGKIGQGVFGEVFEGQDEVHGTVAVKLIRKDHPRPETQDEWDRRKADLLGEAQRLQKSIQTWSRSITSLRDRMGTPSSMSWSIAAAARYNCLMRPAR